MHPWEAILVSDALEGWLAKLQESISTDTYKPSSASVVEIPKGGGAVRPGALLGLADQVFYAALVGACLDLLQPVFQWRSDPPDQCYRLYKLREPAWLESRFTAWTRFRKLSLKEIADGTNYVVSTDIVGCYENIALRTLASDLNSANVPPPVIAALSSALSRWAGVRGRGLPQGYSASDILAKFYLTRVDQALAEAGYRHLRYVDDYRIFSSSQAEAKLALMELQRLLRQRGLNAKAAKTAIMRADSAVKVIDGVMPVLGPLIARYKHEVGALLGLNAEYMTAKELHTALAASGARPPTEMLRAAYQTYFIDGTGDFNKTLFHYLLNRLGEAKDAFALQYVLTLLEEHPEETGAILDYLTAIGNYPAYDDPLLNYLMSDEAVYAYQHHEVIAWRSRSAQVPSEPFVAYVRKVESTARTPAYLKATARTFLGQFGSTADLDRLEESYAAASSDLERAEIVVALHRLEKSRRNGFLNTARADGFLVAKAADRVGSGREMWEGGA